MNGYKVERKCDERGNCLSMTFNQNPKDDYSFVATYDERGNRTSMIYAADPKHKYSWTATYDERGNETSLTFGKKRNTSVYDFTSWVSTYDADGNCLSRIYDDNPEHPFSWCVTGD